jgi:hypothetical protein
MVADIADARLLIAVDKHTDSSELLTSAVWSNVCSPVAINWRAPGQFLWRNQLGKLNNGQYSDSAGKPPAVQEACR